MTTDMLSVIQQVVATMASRYVYVIENGVVTPTDRDLAMTLPEGTEVRIDAASALEVAREQRKSR